MGGKGQGKGGRQGQVKEKAEAEAYKSRFGQRPAKAFPKAAKLKAGAAEEILAMSCRDQLKKRGRIWPRRGLGVLAQARFKGAKREAGG
jgi:hypothetical protein